jgi:hypothetical protein
MTKFIPLPDKLWGEAVTAYQIQFPLTYDTRLQLEQELHELPIPEGLVLRPTPIDALHVTCLSIVSPRAPQYDTSLYWPKVSPSINKVMDDAVRSVDPITLAFEKILVGDSAIIAVAADIPFLKRIRLELASRLPPPPDGFSIPDIIHSSLARYSDESEKIDLGTKILTDHKFCVHAHIDRLRLIKEMVYPSLSFELIHTSFFK